MLNTNANTVPAWTRWHTLGFRTPSGGDPQFRAVHARHTVRGNLVECAGAAERVHARRRSRHHRALARRAGGLRPTK